MPSASSSGLCQLLLNLILRPACLGWLWFRCCLTTIVRWGFRGSLLKPLCILHPDLLSSDTVFRFFLILAIAETEWIIIGVTDRAGVNGRQGLPFTLLA